MYNEDVLGNKQVLQLLSFFIWYPLILWMNMALVISHTANGVNNNALIAVHSVRGVATARWARAIQLHKRVSAYVMKG